MKRNVMVAFVVFVLAIVSIPVAQAADIKEGQWSMTMVTKMSGIEDETAAMKKEMENMPPEAAAMMKQMTGQMGVQMGAGPEGITTTVKQCISSTKPVPDLPSAENCQETHAINGNTVKFEVACSGKGGEMKSSGQMTYTGETMEGTIESHQMEHGRAVDATIEVTGKYLGPCK